MPKKSTAKSVRSQGRSVAVSIPSTKISIQDIVDQATRVETVLGNLHDRLLDNKTTKSPPVYSMTQVAEFCGIEKAACTYWLTKDVLPHGNLNASGTRRVFTLAEARAWVRHHRAAYAKPEGKNACVVCIASFKGGVTKTSTAVMSAQAMSLKGMKCLLIDVDPQGSATTLMGIRPETDVQEEETVAEVFYGFKDSIMSAVRPTYWDGIDIVCASGALHNIEYVVPSKQVGNPTYEFWNLLNKGLDEARSIYDVIIIDTPPSLSYATINALMAADGLIVPIPPSHLDFASSSQFWAIFGDLADQLVKLRNVEKTFDFMHVLLARVDNNDVASSTVRGWINLAYGDKVLPIEIPKTTVTTASAAEYNTVYDIEKYEGSARTFKRAKEAYDRLAEHLEMSIRSSWSAQI